MSHFTVAVITAKKEKLEEMLASYDENLEVEPYIERTKEEIIKEARKRKEDYSKEQKAGKKLDEWQKEYINAETDEELYQAEIDEDYQYDEEGNELTTYNPKTRWDWYEIGGRWRDTLLVREDVKDCIVGRPMLEELFNKQCKKKDCINGYKWCSGAKIKDIEFKKAIEIEKKYNKAIRFWETYVEGKEPLTEEEKEDIKWEVYKKEYYIERYGTKENYAKMQSTFSCWALLDETGWHEKGKMGWWAMNDSTKDSEQLFLEKFTETINKPENQNKYLIIVDCHI